MYIANGTTVDATKYKAFILFKESSAAGHYTPVAKANILKIEPYYSTNTTGRLNEKRAVTTQVTLWLVDGTKIAFDGQDVDNQGSWDNGDEASLNAMIADLSTWITDILP